MKFRTEKSLLTDDEHIRWTNARTVRRSTKDRSTLLPVHQWNVIIRPSCSNEPSGSFNIPEDNTAR
jgi:hypothetical protein